MILAQRLMAAWKEKSKVILLSVTRPILLKIHININSLNGVKKKPHLNSKIQKEKVFFESMETIGPDPIKKLK